MRVLYAGTHFSLYTTQLMAAACNCEVRAFLPIENYQAEVAGLPHPQIELFRRANWRDPLTFMSAIFQFRNLLATWRPHIVHFQETETDLAFALWQQANRARKILSIHDVDPHPGEKRAPRSRRYIRRMRLHADALIVHGQTLKQQLASASGPPPEAIWVMPHPALPVGPGVRSLEDFQGTTFLLMGRMTAYKGVDVLVRAAKQLESTPRDFRVVIAGAGPALEKLRGPISEINSITLIDRFLTPSEMDGLLRQADCLVLPYTEASASGILAQAASIGLPAIATSVGSLPEYVVNGVTGWLVPPADQMALVQAMAEAADNPARLQQFRTASLVVRDSYSLDKIGSRLAEVYASAIAGPTKPLRRSSSG